MKKAPYLNGDELGEVMILSALAQQLEEMVPFCVVPEWRRKLKCIVTYLDNLFHARISYLDNKQLQSVMRRCQHTIVKIHTTDQHKFMDNDRGILQDKTATIPIDDFFDLGDAAMLNCLHCPQGECVKDCKMRDLYHRLSFMPQRVDVQEGQCEYRYDDEIRWVDSDGHRMERI